MWNKSYVHIYLTLHLNFSDTYLHIHIYILHDISNFRVALQLKRMPWRLNTNFASIILQSLFANLFKLNFWIKPYCNYSWKYVEDWICSIELEIKSIFIHVACAGTAQFFWELKNPLFSLLLPNLMWNMSSLQGFCFIFLFLCLDNTIDDCTGN